MSDFNAVEYWRDPPPENAPENYVTGRRKKTGSDFLVDLFAAHLVPREAQILELGCNAGRNLNHLHLVGYKYLHGIEINPRAYLIMRKRFPDLDAGITIGDIHEVLPAIPLRPDVIFTMAVLCHLHRPDATKIFGLMAKRAKKMIVTIENEKTDRGRHWARNYRDIFTGLGWGEVEMYYPVPGHGREYVARVFRRFESWA